MNTEYTYRVRGEKARLRRKKQLQRQLAFFTVLLLLLVIAGVKWAFFSNNNRIVARKLSDRNGTTANESMVEEVPESLKELAEKNPETKEFVEHYFENVKNPKEKDIAKDVKQGVIPMFLQWDERWGYEIYGDDYFALTGCGPTCLSMVYSGLTGKTDMTPYEVAILAEKEGYYVSGSGSSWSMMTGLAEKLGLEAEEGTFSESAIRQHLEKGEPIIAIMGAGDFTTTGHFIVLAGLNPDGTLRVNDPNSKENSEKSWEVSTVMNQMKNLWVYR